jgi:hypothetical protein
MPYLPYDSLPLIHEFRGGWWLTEIGGLAFN